MLIDFVILLITKKITKNNAKNIKLVVASFLGALYTVLTLVKELHFLSSISLKLSISTLMIIIAFTPYKLKEFIKLYSTFYLISFVFAGAALSLVYFTDSEVYIMKGLFFIKGITLKILLIAILLSLIIIKFTKNYFFDKGNKILLYTTVILNDKIANFTGLIDTGNSLKDPISNFPVIIVEFKAIENLLPKEVQDIFKRYQENDLNIISELMDKTKNLVKFRLIPFKSIGKENGMLIGFKPDSVKFNEFDENFNNIIIGIYNSSLTNSGEYQALLSPEIIDLKEGEVNNA